MDSTTKDGAPSSPIITSTTTLSPESVNLPLAIALPICLFVFLSFLVILAVCLVRKKKKICSKKAVESQMSRGSVEGSSDNGDNNNNKDDDGETDNHQTHGQSDDGEILPGKTFVDADSPVVEKRNSLTTERNPDEESQMNEKDDDEDDDNVETTSRTIVDGQETHIPVSVVHERRTSDVAMETLAMETAAMETVVVKTVVKETADMETVVLVPPVGQQSQLRETAIAIPAEEQDNFQTYIAVYSFKAEHENQMSLTQDDIVLVSKTHEHEGWLCGWKRNSSETGWFPKSHVREVEQKFFRETSIGSKLSDSTEADDDDFDEDVGKYECQALYSFAGAKDGELSFKAGDSLMVHQGVEGTGHWLYGQRGNKVGWFPATYVEVIPGSKLLTSSDRDSTATEIHDLDETLQRVAKISPTDITPEGSLLSPSDNTTHNFPSSSKEPVSKMIHKTNKEDAPPPGDKSRRSSILSGKPNISDRLGLSRIKHFRKRKGSTDVEPVTLKEVVLVPSSVSHGKNLHDETSVEARQKQTKSIGKKGKKERPREVVPPPPEAPRRQSLLKLHNRKREKMEMSSPSCNVNQSLDDQHLTLSESNTIRISSNDSEMIAEECNSSEPIEVVIEPTEDTNEARDVVSEESDCIVMSVSKPQQSTADDKRRQWDMTLENFDRILEGSNDFDDAGSRLKTTNFVSSHRKGLSWSAEKAPDHRERSIPQVTHPAATANGSGPSTLQLTPPPQVSIRKRRQERSKDPAPIREDKISQTSELELLSFAPPGFNDSEEVLSEKFLSYLSQVGSIDKSRLCPADGRGNHLQRQSSLHPPLPPKPSWPPHPPSDEKNEEHRQNEGDVFKEDSNDGQLTFVIQSGRSSRQSLSTLLLPDVVRGYITTDEYEDFQIPPPAGFSTDPHENVGKTYRVVSLDSFREIQTPRYFGRTFYEPEDDDSSDDDYSSVTQDSRWKKTVSERVEVPADTDTVVWRPWGHSEPKFTRHSYARDVESRLDGSRSRHDNSSHGVMFKLADGSVVFDESDVGLESVI